MPDDATLPQSRALADGRTSCSRTARCAGPCPRTAPAPPPDPHERGCRIGHRRRARGRCFRGDRPVDEPGRAVPRRPGPDSGTQHDSGSRPAHRRADAAGAAYAELTEWMEDCAGGEDYEVAVQSGEVQFSEQMTGELLGGGFGVFVDNRLVLVGDAIMLMSLMSPGQDWNWSYDPDDTDLPLNPMFRMLSEAAANLAGQND
jgi:hypothetical protein